MTISLLYAHVTKYKPGTDELRTNSFEVISMDNIGTGVITCDEERTLEDWVRAISSNIAAINSQSIMLTNKTLLPGNQVMHLGWVSERVGVKGYQTWRNRFLTLKGPDVCLFESPPLGHPEWTKPESSYKIIESVVRILKDTQCDDRRRHCLVLESGDRKMHYLSVESRQELLRIEKSWHRANYHAVKHLASKTFGCTHQDRVCGLTLDLDAGFSLYDNETKCHMWRYRFSQLRASSDDGSTVLRLVFSDGDALDSKELETTNLQQLIFSMHAFLSAKLASVDPAFLVNL